MDQMNTRIHGLFFSNEFMKKLVFIASILAIIFTLFYFLAQEEKLQHIAISTADSTDIFSVKSGILKGVTLEGDSRIEMNFTIKNGAYYLKDNTILMNLSEKYFASVDNNLNTLNTTEITYTIYIKESVKNSIQMNKFKTVKPPCSDINNSPLVNIFGDKMIFSCQDESNSELYSYDLISDQINFLETVSVEEYDVINTLYADNENTYYSKCNYYESYCQLSSTKKVFDEEIVIGSASRVIKDSNYLFIIDIQPEMNNVSGSKLIVIDLTANSYNIVNLEDVNSFLGVKRENDTKLIFSSKSSIFYTDLSGVKEDIITTAYCVTSLQNYITEYFTFTYTDTEQAKCSESPKTIGLYDWEKAKLHDLRKLENGEKAIVF